MCGEACDSGLFGQFRKLLSFTALGGSNPPASAFGSPKRTYGVTQSANWEMRVLARPLRGLASRFSGKFQAKDWCIHRRFDKIIL